MGKSRDDMKNKTIRRVAIKQVILGRSNEYIANIIAELLEALVALYSVTFHQSEYSTMEKTKAEDTARQITERFN